MEPTRVQRLKLWAKTHTDEIVTGSFLALSAAAGVTLAIFYRQATKELAYAEGMATRNALPNDIRKEMINGVERAVNVLSDKDGAELWMFVIPPAE